MKEKNTPGAPFSGQEKNAFIQQQLETCTDKTIKDGLNLWLDYYHNLYQNAYPNKKEFRSFLLSHLTEYVDFFQDGNFSDAAKIKHLHEFGRRYSRILFGANPTENPYMAEQASHILGLKSSTKSRVDQLLGKKAA